ncbi:death-associated inhibitor of apoptosis 1 isoform X1 [Frankliniella occidentalis]|uniref:Death-associated inhibitor of apoptosis 1 isoform X1 n=2 Tax=Frankliniella occidentalis TaxID=133901 RepID=A0A6J1SXR0_FRAOC|nr:death-associated inhibitor of apoptosis 1 isoform X1 [Frankliniella occidentalis]
MSHLSREVCRPDCSLHQHELMPPNPKWGGVIGVVNLLPDIGRHPSPQHRPTSLLSTRSHDYRSEKERLESFAGFPTESMDVRQLAAAGFWYTKSDDIVRCAFCNVEVGRWEEGDDPIEEHKKWSKNCSFLNHMETGNIPVDPSNPPPLPPVERGDYDECGIYNIKKSDNCPVIPSLEKLGIQKRYNPAHPAYVTSDARIESYESWPIGLKLRPQELAEAGFFYTGLGDKTICFQCGGALKDWAETDEPWREHALYFSKCGHVVQTKGREFIAEVLGKRPATLTPEEIRALAIPKEYLNVVQQHPSPDVTSEASSSSSVSHKANEPQPVSETTNKSTKSIDDARACKLCFSEEIGVAFLPCGHLVSCVNCVPSLKTCAVCREPFSATVRVYLS